MNRSNSDGPSIQQTNQKKKPYRARGCRGGASRKSRKKQTINDPSRQNEENDPSRLNNNSENHSDNIHAPQEDTSNKRDTKHASGGADKPRSDTQVDCQSKMRTLSILPKGSGLSVHQGASGHASEANAGVRLMDQSQHHANNICDSKPILPNVVNDSTSDSARRGANILSAIARPTAASGGRSNNREGHISGGFSFFCISPRSFLSGQRKTKSPRLN